MMRINLITRVVLLTALVATFATTTTAVLAWRGAGHRSDPPDHRSQLEVDRVIEAAIADYALNHADWSAIEPLIMTLARQTGRRIGLAEPDGTVIADSATLLGQGRLPLPSTPAAQLDPTEVHLASGPPPSLDGQSGRATIAISGWQLTDAERRSRERLLEQANQCLAEESVSVWLDPSSPAPDGRVFGRVQPGDSPSGAAAELRSSDCIPGGLTAPSAAARRLNAERTELLRVCLDRAGLDYQESVSADGLRRLTPSNGATSQTWQQCSADAHAAAIDPYVASPAGLYLGVSERFDPLGPDWWRTVGTTLAVIIVAVTISIAAGRRLLRPVATLTTAAQQLAAGDLSVRVPTSTDDEVGRLGRAFNRMAVALGEHDQQRKALVGDIAHELRTPLTTVRSQLEAAADGVVEIDRALVGSVRDETRQLERLVDDLQDLALADAGMLAIHPEKRDAADLVRGAAARQLSRARAADIRLMVFTEDDLVVHADPGRIHQAVGNLIDNALQHTPPGGTVTVTAGRQGPEVSIMVADTGPGVHPRHLPHVFDRFYRADRSRSRRTGGSGLGLAITRHLVQAHGGSVCAESTPGEGARFVILLPMLGPDLCDPGPDCPFDEDKSRM